MLGKNPSFLNGPCNHRLSIGYSIWFFFSQSMSFISSFLPASSNFSVQYLNMKNHGITGFLRLEGIPGDCLVQQAYSEWSFINTVSPGHVQLGFEYIQKWRLHNFSEQPVPLLEHLYSEKGH